MDNIDKVYQLSKMFTYRVNLECTPTQIEDINKINSKEEGLLYFDLQEFCSPEVIMRNSFIKVFNRKIEKNRHDNQLIILAFKLSVFNEFKI